MKEIVMPQFGETAEEEIVIKKWLKKPGAIVKIGDLLLEVETEKSSLEIEAVDSGTLVKIVKQEGEIVKPETVIGYIDG